MAPVPNTPDPISAHYEEGRVMRFLLHDRAAKFPTSCYVVFATEGIKVRLAPYRAPNANAYAERWVRSAREECLDHLLIFNECHLNHVLTENSQYYNQSRPHQGASAADLRISTSSTRIRASAATRDSPEGFSTTPIVKRHK